jgi:hypothetical protein
MGAEINTIDTDTSKEDWMNSKWRPMMGWMYMAVCSCDFVLFPILWSLLQTTGHGAVTSQWQPLTLQGAGLFHIAMGAVLGIAAYGRTQEKINGSNNGNMPLPPAPQPGFNTGFNAAPAPAASSGFGTGFVGKAAPAPQQDPAL